MGVVPYTDGTVQQQGPYPTSGVPSTIAVAASRAWASVPPVQNTALIGEASVMMDNGRLGKLSKEQQVSGDGTRQVCLSNDYTSTKDIYYCAKKLKLFVSRLGGRIGTNHLNFLLKNSPVLLEEGVY